MLILSSLVLENLILLKSKVLHIVERELPQYSSPCPCWSLELHDNFDNFSGLLHQN